MRLLSYGRINKARSEGQEIEGGELELLRHADLSRFRAIVLEFHPYRLGLQSAANTQSVRSALI